MFELFARNEKRILIEIILLIVINHSSVACAKKLGKIPKRNDEFSSLLSNFARDTISTFQSKVNVFF
jgi:hypothetical protein